MVEEVLETSRLILRRRRDFRTNSSTDRSTIAADLDYQKNETGILRGKDIKDAHPPTQQIDWCVGEVIGLSNRRVAVI